MMPYLDICLERKKVLITGADGFIGSHLTERLVNAGASVTALLHDKRLQRISHIVNDIDHIIVRPIEDKDVIKDIVAEAPLIVYHLAGSTDVRYALEHPLETHKINVDGTLHMLEAARQLQERGLERLIFSSSSVVYGGGSNNPLSEDTPLMPGSVYAATKASAEHYCTAYRETFRLPIVILRLFNAYGLKNPKSPTHNFITKALANEPITIDGDGSQTRDFVYIDDVVTGFELAAQNNRATGEIFNLGSGREISIRKFAAKIIELCGSKSDLAFGPPRPSQDRRLWCNNEHAHDVLGWEPMISLEEGLKMTIEGIRG